MRWAARAVFNMLFTVAGIALLWWWRPAPGCPVLDWLTGVDSPGCATSTWLTLCYGIVARGVLLLGELAWVERARRRKAKRDVHS